MVRSSPPDEHASDRAQHTLADADPAADPEHPDELAQGMSVGRYVILSRIGVGGMGTVYTAYDPELDRKIAIKVLRRRRRRGGSEEVDRARMLREAQALARLSHPNVIAVHDAGLHAGRVFLAMDFVEGEDLRAWVRLQRPAWPSIVAAYVDAARGLAAAHEAGLVHRDFKPENAVRDPQGRVRVLDFGLARTTGNTGPHPSLRPRSREEIRKRLLSDGYVSIDTPLTVEGARVGTPAYMAPEQHLGEATDARTDQFALCVSLYESLYDQLPFPDDSAHAVAFAAIEGEVREPPRSTRVPTRIRRVIERGLSPDPAARWPSLEALVDALQRDPSRDRRRIVLGVGAAGLVAAAAWTGARAPSAESPCQGAHARIDATWNDARADAIARRFATTERPYAARSSATVAATFEAYADAWAEAHTAACEATHVHHEQSAALLDMRMACLDRRRQALDALATRLQDADGDAVDHAVAAAEGLPPIAACADLDALRRGPIPPPEAHDVLAGLADAAALLATGREEDAITECRALVARAREIHADAATAEGLALLGAALEATGAYAEAEQRLVEAELAAEAVDDLGLLARTRTLLVLVVGDRLAHADRGRLWAQLAAPAIERAGGELDLLVQLETNLGHLAAREGEPDEGLVHQRRALELLEASEEAPALQRASVEADLASALASRQQIDEGTERAERALALWTAELGPDHRRTAVGHAVLAYVHDAAGDYEAALPEHERAVAIMEAVLGPDAPPISGLRANLGICAIRMGDLARGEQELRRVLAIERNTFGDRHVEVATALGNLAGLLRMRGELDEAETLAREALELRRELLPVDHPEVARSIATLANVLEEAGREAEVVPMREQVVDIMSRRYGAEHPKLVVDLANLAYSAIAAGQLERAGVAARRALAIADAHEVAPEVHAYAILMTVRVDSEHGRDAATLRPRVDDAVARLGTRAAPAERKILAELVARHGWADLEGDTHPPPADGAL